MDVPAACRYPDGWPGPLRLVDLGHFEITAFGRDRANEAVAHAAAHGGPFRMTVIQPR